jgi:hypothetical protein
MAFAPKTQHSHTEVWTFLATDLPGGSSHAIQTGIRLVGIGGNFDRALDNCRARYQETARVGAPVVPPPELLQVGGLLVCLIENTAAPVNFSGGEVEIEFIHSAVR